MASQIFLLNLNPISSDEPRLERSNDPNPSDVYFRVNLRECRFPITFSQEGPGDFACDGWTQNNCQDFFHDCVLQRQLLWINNFINACMINGDEEFYYFDNAGFLVDSSNTNGDGIDVSFFILNGFMDYGGCFQLETGIYSPQFIDSYTCYFCVQQTQEDCCN